MKIRDLFRMRDSANHPTPDEILDQQIKLARAMYPQHGGKYPDAVLLAFRASNLAKNLDERTAERDSYRRAIPRGTKNSDIWKPA